MKSWTCCRLNCYLHQFLIVNADPLALPNKILLLVARGVGSVKLGRGQLEFRGGTEKKLNLSSIKPHVIYVYF